MRCTALIACLAALAVGCEAYDRTTYANLLDADIDAVRDVSPDTAPTFDAPPHGDALDHEVGIDGPLDSHGDALDTPNDLSTDGHDVATDGACTGCGAGQLCCAGACVNGTTDPNHCGTCAMACPGTTCSGGQCTNNCLLGRLDCDGNAVDGCEVDASSDPANCGSCGHACPTGFVCNSGVCGCPMGTADCDSVASNGCETQLTTDPLHCGACTTQCGPGQACVAGACGCATGRADCDGLASNGCEVDTTTDASNCGTCSHSCGAHGTCAMGQCGCATGFLRCPSTATDCNTSSNDSNNCGACGNVCPSTTPVCSGGACVISCPTGQRLCGTLCSDMTTDPLNCGTCGNACPAGPNQTAVCSGGVCSTACATGFADCNGTASDGCEVDIRTSNTNCGACGTACTSTQVCNSAACSCPTGTRDCGSGRCAACCADTDCNDGNACTTDTCTSSGTCSNIGCAAGTLCCGGLVCHACCANSDCASLPGNHGCGADGTCDVCAPGYLDCNGSATDGCEVNATNDVSNCGACGTACTFPNAVAACVSGGCVIMACNAPYADCDGSSANGCETNLAIDPNHCGTCTTVCSGTTWSCSSGVCATPNCPMGFGDCDGNSANGCETDITSSVANCGACGNACSYANATATCTNSMCALGTCNTGFANCDGSSTNGCEINLNTSVTHCGSCTTACSYPNASALCNAGTCAFNTCNTGFGDCNANTADGCEVSLNTNVNDCGSCGHVCASGPNSTPTCGGGVCGLACTAGYGNCDANASTGCEANLDTDVNNCGSCGHVCAAGQLCGSGACFTPTLSFQVDSLGTNDCATTDTSSITGTDRGGIAVSPQRVFYNGSFGTGIFDLPSFSNGTSTSVYDALVSDLHSGATFVVGTRMGGAITSTGGRVNALLGIDPNTGALTGTNVSLSTQITLATTSGFFSGYGEVLIHNGSQVYRIDTVSGTVTALGAMATPTHVACTAWAYWGVAENYGGVHYLDYVQNSTTIVRTRVPDGLTTTLGTFTNLGNMCDITFSPQRSRWYFHVSGSNQFGGTGQLLGYCAGTWSAPDMGCPSGTTTCSSTCHDLTQDDLNCAACGTACTTPSVCVASACTTPCASGQTLCSGTCRNTSSDVNNCGACGNVCPGGANASPYCSGGFCYLSCNGGYANCNGSNTDGCEVNIWTSNANCGSCGAACGGTCCTGTCADTTIDPSNCGACGSVCSSPDECVSSACSCLLTCNGACVDPHRDASNCGGCGITCASGSQCVDGVCTAPYTSYVESTSPQTFIDACQQTVHSSYLPLRDDYTQSVVMPFDFQFYNTRYSSLWFSSNGVEGFAAANSYYFNSCLPDTGFSANILPFWDDLYTRSTGICTATVGASPNRQFVITWENVHFCCTDDPTVNLTFSLILSERSNLIDIVYGTMTGTNSNGASATIGVQNVGGTVYTQFSCNTASVASGTALRFTGM